MRPPRFVSFFAGIGGMDLGLERAGMECVGQVEIDSYCRKVLAKHWPHVKRMEDVRDVQGHEFGEFDYLVAGFPCQDVSNAGKRAGVSASRSGLYREVVRCLRVVRPYGAVLENVAALLERGRGMGTVLGDLAAIGYRVEWDCVPAGAFGAPHVRDRVFMVAHAECISGEDSEVPLPWERVFRGQPRGIFGLQIPGSHWQTNEPPLCWMDDGFPGACPLMKAYGNAVVPQVAEHIGRHVLRTWNNRHASE